MINCCFEPFFAVNIYNKLLLFFLQLAFALSTTLEVFTRENCKKRPYHLCWVQKLPALT